LAVETTEQIPRSLTEYASLAARPPMSSVLHQLMTVLEDRKLNPPPNSYTAQLYAGGDTKIGAKITEESQELIEAAGETGEQGHRHIVHESADLIYHLLVLLAHHDIKLDEVEFEIARRFGQSGLEEKTKRTVQTGNSRALQS
jgi:phosphoribosyl-ATP pyrophosphohydrolase